MKHKTINFDIALDQHRRLVERKKKTGISITGQIRTAIEEYLHKQRRREQYR